MIAHTAVIAHTVGIYSTLVAIVFPLLTAIVGGVCVLQLAIAKTLRDSNGDLRSRVDDLEKQQQLDKATIAGQTAEISALGRVVTGEVHLTAIADVLQHHHERAETYWTQTEAVLAHTDQMLTEIVEEIRRPPQ